MKKACAALMSIAFLLVAHCVFAGDFAGDLKGGFKSTVITIYQGTGQLPVVGQTLQGAERMTYNTVAVSGYNAVNGVSMAVNGVNIDKNLNNAYASAVLNPLDNAIKAGTVVRDFKPGTAIKDMCANGPLAGTYKNADGASQEITGSGIELNANTVYGIVVRPPVVVPLNVAKGIRSALPESKEEEFKLMLAKELRGQRIRDPELTVTLGSGNETSRFEQKCLKDPYWKEYDGKSGTYYTLNQCLLNMKRHGEVKDYQIGYEVPQH